MKIILLAVIVLFWIYWRICKQGGYPSEEGLDENCQNCGHKFSEVPICNFWGQKIPADAIDWFSCPHWIKQ